MYRPIKRKAGEYYEIEEFTGDESLALNFNDTPMHIVRGAMVFFWTLFSSLLSNTLSSIPKKAEMEKVDLESVGVGINLLSELQENLKLEFEKWEQKIYTNHSRYYLT